jgi:hypothetical protein
LERDEEKAMPGSLCAMIMDILIECVGAAIRRGIDGRGRKSPSFGLAVHGNLFLLVPIVSVMIFLLIDQNCELPTVTLRFLNLRNFRNTTYFLHCPQTPTRYLPNFRMGLAHP